MEYIIGYLMLNQLAFVGASRIAHQIGGGESNRLQQMLNSYKGFIIMAVIGSPLLLVALISAIHDVVRGK